MLLAVFRGLAALGVVARPPGARVSGATPDVYVHHVVLGMLLAVHRGPGSLDIEPWSFRA